MYIKPADDESLKSTRTSCVSSQELPGSWLETRRPPGWPRRCSRCSQERRRFLLRSCSGQVLRAEDAAFWNDEPAPALYTDFSAPVSLSCGGGGVGGEAAVAVSEEVVWGKQGRT